MSLNFEEYVLHLFCNVMEKLSQGVL